MSREKSVAVVMLCGPRSPSDHPSFIRIQKAIELAFSMRTALYIVGDDHEGSDVRLYASMAKEAGVQTVTPVLNTADKKNTQTNAEAFARVLADTIAKEATADSKMRTELRELFLVTEGYHMPRATLLFKNALRAVCKRGDKDFSPKVIEAPVVSATPTATGILFRENELRTKLGIREQITWSLQTGVMTHAAR